MPPRRAVATLLPSHRAERVRNLALCLATSALLHAGAFALLPRLPELDRVRVDVLEVTLARPEPELPPLVRVPKAAEPPPDSRSHRRSPRDPATARATAPTREEPRERAAHLESLAPRQETPAPMPEAPQAQPRSPAVERGPEPPIREEIARSPLPEPKSAAGDQPAAVTPPGVSAAYLRNPAPRYPISARRRGEQGTVTLKVFVTRDGSASAVAVDKTSGSPALDEAAVEAVKSWRFSPARQGSQATEAWVLVPIVFKLQGSS